MEPKGPDAQIHKTPHILSEDDFNKAPEKLAHFKVGEPVTRENFVFFLITTFGVARGRPEVQRMFLLWLKHEYGFDYPKVFDTFLSVGLASLSAKEREEIAIHKHIIIDKTTMNSAVQYSHIGIGPKMLPGFFDFDEINDFVDFNNCVIRYLKHIKNLNTPKK